MDLKLDIKHLEGYIKEEDCQMILPELERVHRLLHNRDGVGSEFTGWMDLPTRMDEETLDEIVALGEEVRSHSDCLINIGIGGSYMGLRASLEFLISDQKIPVYYAGNNLSSGYLYFLLKSVQDKNITVVVISKSGTTTEPALAFRIVKKFMEEKYGKEECKKRIICITDPVKGALRHVADEEGYRTFPVPSDVGGRFSVLTHVGLVPLAIAGIDIRELIVGARKAQEHCSELSIEENISYRYGVSRYLLNKNNKDIEILSTFYQRFSFLEEWWKQLFGESEGKDGKGIFPASVSFTSDLHSLGQYIQEGQRNLFETFLVAENSGFEMIIPKSEKDIDNFNCVANKDLDYVNKQAYKATAIAHYEGGIPNMTITIPEFSASSLGQLFYFFEKAVAVTGYLLNVNPFDQPGVEAYKTKMFELLGRK